MAVTLNASTTTGLVQSADTSGTVEIQSNGTTRLTVASGGVTTTGNTSIANLTATGTFGGGVITSGTAVASTSGTSIDFTSIPSWVKRITVMFSDVSTNGSSEYLIQIGTSAGIQTTNYLGQATYVGAGVAGVNFSSGFLVRSDDSNEVSHGLATLCLLNSATGLFVMSYATGHSNENYMAIGAGSKTLSGTLDRVRITTVNGTDTFDAGSINILYEG